MCVVCNKFSSILIWYVLYVPEIIPQNIKQNISRNTLFCCSKFYLTDKQYKYIYLYKNIYKQVDILKLTVCGICRPFNDFTTYQSCQYTYIYFHYTYKSNSASINYYRFFQLSKLSLCTILRNIYRKNYHLFPRRLQ